MELDFAVLNGLSRDDLFALAELAAHGRLTAAGHQAIFRNAQGESLLQLERLRHQCLVERGEADADPEYRLMPLFSNRIIKHLKTANVLY